jgi:hypothetical protein
MLLLKGIDSLFERGQSILQAGHQSLLGLYCRFNLARVLVETLQNTGFHTIEALDEPIACRGDT